MRVMMKTTAVLLAGLAAPAHAAGERAELAVPFTESRPGVPTGLALDVRYLNPENRDAKPPSITKVVLRLPEGTRLDTTALPVCEATDEEMRLLGRAACPPDSQVGAGTLEAFVGAPGDPQRTDVTLFNGRDELIEIVTFAGTNTTAGIDRLRIDGNVLTGNPPATPGGPPDGRTNVGRITWDIPAHGRYLVTPPACDGAWRTVGEFGFADGGEATVVATQPCERPAPAPVQKRSGSGSRMKRCRRPRSQRETRSTSKPRRSATRGRRGSKKRCTSRRRPPQRRRKRSG
jgi:hypothetical protein